MKFQYPIKKSMIWRTKTKKSSYASNKIEDNPLTEEQADEAIERGEHKHFLKPEQEHVFLLQRMILRFIM